MLQTVVGSCWKRIGSSRRAGWDFAGLRGVRQSGFPLKPLSIGIDRIFIDHIPRVWDSMSGHQKEIRAAIRRN
jgi:hypothetical protein